MKFSTKCCFTLVNFMEQKRGVEKSEEAKYLVAFSVLSLSISSWRTSLGKNAYSQQSQYNFPQHTTFSTTPSLSTSFVDLQIVNLLVCLSIVCDLLAENFQLFLIYIISLNKCLSVFAQPVSASAFTYISIVPCWFVFVSMGILAFQSN